MSVEAESFKAGTIFENLTGKKKQSYKYERNRNHVDFLRHLKNNQDR